MLPVTVMTQFSRILSKVNLIYRNIFVSSIRDRNKKSIFSLHWLVTYVVFERRLKYLAMFLSFFGKVISPGWVIVRIPKVILK